MPNLGDVKYSDELGKIVSNGVRGDKYIWWECRTCKRQYWKRKYDIIGSATQGLCIRCCRKGSRSGRWQGGRFKIGDGYILVYVKPDDHYYPMATSGGGKYVFEHRLVMAKSLGRCLNAKEIVHHLNGIRDDNRRENLALTTAKAHPSKTFISQLQKRIRDLEQLHLGI